MCGATSQQTALANSQQTFAGQLQQDASQRFVDQGKTISTMGNILQNVQNGKLLPGFDAATQAALSTNALDATAANYRNTLQAVQGQNAGRGGSSGTTSGILTQEQESVGNAAAATESTLQNENIIANEKQAEANTFNTIAGYNTIAGEQNPLGFANSTEGAYQGATTAANDVAQANNQVGADIGAVVGAGVGAISGTSTFKNL